MLSVLLALSGCAANVTVDQVMTDPGRYQGKTVVLTGIVDKPTAVVGYGVYRLTNGDKYLWVQTTKGVPQAGATARVTGRVYDAYNLSGVSLPLPEAVRRGVILVESSRTTP